MQCNGHHEHSSQSQQRQTVRAGAQFAHIVHAWCFDKLHQVLMPPGPIHAPSQIDAAVHAVQVCCGRRRPDNLFEYLEGLGGVWPLPKVVLQELHKPPHHAARC